MILRSGVFCLSLDAAARTQLVDFPMAYRVCMFLQPMFIQIEDFGRWNYGQVHAEYPKSSGGLKLVIDLFLTTVFSYPAPNMSLIFESGTGTVGDNGLPTGCYTSVHNNQSDISLIPVEYPIVDYEKVDPIQVIHEGQLLFMSVYKVDDKNSIEYADLLKASLKSFDMSIWYVILLSFIVFSGLLYLRRLIITARDTISYSPLFETFTHLIGQETTDFEDKSGRLISYTMTIGFFLILSFFLNLMSTDLVVVTKPKTINTYRDIMTVENMTVVFFTMTYDAIEFDEARPETIQEEFWNKFKDNHETIDLEKNLTKHSTGKSLSC